MRAKPIAVTINNYPGCISDIEGYEAEEVVVLENAPSTVRFSKLGNERVSPKPHHDLDVVDDADTKLKQRRIKKRQRGIKTIVTISCIVSVAALVLVCALVFGFIEPKNSKKLNNCLCGSEKLIGRSTSIKGGKYSDLEDEIQRLKNSSQNVNKTLVLMQEAFERETEDISQITEKFENFKEDLTTNVTHSLQKIDKFSFVIEKFVNKTNKEMAETRNYTTTMLSTMRGPRGYNGSEGIAGPPGPPGAQGEQGQRGTTIKSCRNHTETQLVKVGKGFGEFRKPSRSTSELYFNLKCETDAYGKAQLTKKGNLYICQCMHKSGTMKDYKCILKYTRCTLIYI